MEVIDLSDGFGDSHQHTPLCKFKRKFDLQSVCDDFKFVNIRVKPVPIIYGWKLEQYDVDVILNRLNFHLKIVCSTFQKEIKSLKIKIYNTNKQKELAICTNFLQRQKNLHLALNVLRKCSKLFEDRKTVLQSLTSHGPRTLAITRTEDSGYCIKCVSAKENFLFFESNWAVGWNYRNYDVFDFVDFMLNNKDKLFNTKVKPLMKSLTYPHNPLSVKVELWTEILRLVRVCLEQGTVPSEAADPEAGGTTSPPTSCLPEKSSLRRSYKKKLLENKDLYLIYPEIIEIVDSDDDRSLEVTVESSDSEVEIVGCYSARRESSSTGEYDPARQ